MGAERALDLEEIIYISILEHQLVGMLDILLDNKFVPWRICVEEWLKYGMEVQYYLITWSNITYQNSKLTLIPNNSLYPEMNFGIL